MNFSLAIRILALAGLLVALYLWSVELPGLKRAPSSEQTSKNLETTPSADNIDRSFKTPTLNENGVRSIALQNDGKILLGGHFSSVNNEKHTNIVRLNADGSIDETFVDVGDQTPIDIENILILDSGKILVGGHGKLIQLNADGSYDYDFFPVTDAGDIHSIQRLKYGDIIIAGSPGYKTASPPKCIRRFHSDGTEDKTFDTGNALEYCAAIHSAVLQPDEKIVIAGKFGDSSAAKPPPKLISQGGKGNFEETTRKGIMRLYSNGDVDKAFEAIVNDSVYAVALQTDGKILIGGDFTTVNNIPCHRIARLNSDGTLDPSFNVNASADRRIEVLAIQDNGKILLGGSFENINNLSKKHIARLNGDGTLDSSFNVDGFFSLDAIQVQKDGSIIAASRRLVLRLQN